MRLIVGIILAVCAFSILDESHSARILIILPLPSYSHQIPFEPFIKELSQRGHDIVFLTVYPEPSLNVTQISIREFAKPLQFPNFVQWRMEHTWLEVMESAVWNIVYDLVDLVYKHPKVKELYAPGSNQTFDLVMAEYLFTPSLFPLAHRFNAPLIGLISIGNTIYNKYILGENLLPSFPSTWEMQGLAGFNVPFWQRVKNYVNVWLHVYYVFTTVYSEQQRIAEKYLGKDIPSIVELSKNVSVVFMNQPEYLTFGQPRHPKVIHFNSFHVSEELKPIPNEIKRFIEDSPNGFIYFSLGTNAMSSKLPLYNQQQLCEIFASLPYKILWKYEAELEEKPDNVMTAKWLPQRSILAHPNIKLYIYQGGLQSTEEAVHFAVPLVGIPILADQDHIVMKLASLGVAKHLSYQTMTKNLVQEAILTVLNDPGYKKRMLQLSKLSKDQPYNSMKNAIWWTEFILRNKRCEYFNFHMAEEPFYRRYDVDVIAFLSIMLFIASLCAIFVTYKLTKFLYHNVIISQNHKQKVS